MVVVDTNVAVVANGKSEQASDDCVLICIQRLKEIVEGKKKLIIDDGWRIIREYKNNLRSQGQPGLGDAFFKWVLTNWANPLRCEQVKITETGTSGTEFSEFPSVADLDDFDPSDRKFVAVALAHPLRPPILQAVDGKWKAFEEALIRSGVTVDFICSNRAKSPTVRKQNRLSRRRRKS
ncbi:MAG: hypothetical protein U0Z53_17890 [Blastocatellia bacterium]